MKENHERQELFRINMLRTKGFRKIGVFFAAFFPICYIEGKQITDGSKQRNGQPTVGTAVWKKATGFFFWYDGS